jgi:HEAT repeat protein
MLRIKPVLFAWFCLLASAGLAPASEIIPLRLHGRVDLSDTIVLGRVVDPTRALVAVERVLKGAAPRQITLIAYVDGYAVAARKPLLQDARELIFLRKEGAAYAPVQNQYGRLAVVEDRVSDSSQAEPRRLSETVASIKRLVAFQARASRGGIEADRAYVAALRHSDVEVRNWAFDTADQRIKGPSSALADALLARWPKDAGDVASVVLNWRLRRAAPLVAKTLTTSRDGDERAAAAMALGGTGDLTYLPLLRRVASADAHAPARAEAYGGIMWMLGPDSLGDLRLGAKDAHERVRAQAVVDAYNLLELEQPEPRWSPASSAFIAEVRAFLTEMLSDPARLVSDNARSMLANIAQHRP